MPERPPKRSGADPGTNERPRALSPGEERAKPRRAVKGERKTPAKGPEDVPNRAPAAEKRARARRGAEGPPEPEPAPEVQEPVKPALHALWTGTLGFGLVAIPVELFPATRSGRPSLRMLAEDGTPLVRRSFDETGRMLDRAEITRAYEVEKDRFVEVTDDELDALAPEDGKDIKLSVFVERSAISPMYFERGYVLTPGKGSNSAYRLLARTLEHTGQVGVATFVMHDTEHLVCIHAERGVLRAQLLRFFAEVRSPDTVGLPSPQEPTERTLAAARRALLALREADSGELLAADAQRVKLAQLAAKKLEEARDLVPVKEHEPVDETPSDELADVVDLVAVLRRSLAQGGGSKGTAS